MYIEERHSQILHTLHKYGRIDVSELASSFQVSKETIRRDLKILESQNLLHRTHGGAIAPESSVPEKNETNFESPVAERALRNVLEKKAICKEAAKKLQNGDTIFVDNSSTCTYLYQYIPKHIQLIILTNSIPFLVECAKDLSPQHTVICLGGILKNLNLSLYGNMTLGNANQYFPNKAFVSCTGITEDLKITDSGVQEIEMKRSLLSASSEIILLADHTKFTHSGQVYLCDMKDISCIITDIHTDFSPLHLPVDMENKIIFTK